MDIQITARHEAKAPAELQQHISDELAKLERFYDHITSCHVILDSEHEKTVAEIALYARGHSFTASAKDASVGKAIVDALGKIERQLKKLNEKTKSHHAQKND
jgi:putative sigma-54 modulation protein